MTDTTVELVGLSLNAKVVPSVEDLERELSGILSDECQSILGRPLRKYVDIMHLYPTGTVSELDDIAEAAAIGDRAATALEWVIMLGETNYVDCFGPEGEKPSETTEQAIVKWQEIRDFLRPAEERAMQPLTEEKAIAELDSSIALIEGALASGAMKIQGVPEIESATN